MVTRAIVNDDDVLQMRLQHHAHDGTFQSQGGIITGNDDVDFASLWHRCGNDRGLGGMGAQISRYFNADLPWVEQKLGFLCVSWAVDAVWWRLLREMRGGAGFCKRCFYMYLSLLSTKHVGKNAHISGGHVPAKPAFMKAAKSAAITVVVSNSGSQANTMLPWWCGCKSMAK